MESSVQANVKCGSSDFSIERILSDDTRSDRVDTDQTDVPSWLCCTRYRPPRIPRAASGCRARRSGRHARVPFTAGQAAALEAAYARAPYLAPPALRALAAALHLRDDRIKIWFQNRRARERREKSTNIAPPVGVTLTPTTRLPSPSPAWDHSPDLINHFVRHRPPHSVNTDPSHTRTSSETDDDIIPDLPLDVESVD